MKAGARREVFRLGVFQREHLFFVHIPEMTTPGPQQRSQVLRPGLRVTGRAMTFGVRSGDTRGWGFRRKASKDVYSAGPQKGVPCDTNGVTGDTGGGCVPTGGGTADRSR